MRIPQATIAAVTLLVLAVAWAAAAEPVSVIGYNRITVPAQSDVIVSVPFVQPPVGSVVVDSTTGTGVKVPVGSFAGGEFSNGRYYVRFTTGNAAGRWATVTSNTTDELVFQDTSFLADVAGGNKLTIYPHQTLSKVFPAKLAGRSFLASTGAFFTLNVQTTVRLWTPSVGIDQAPASTYYFHETGVWKALNGSPADNVIVPPGAALVIRNTSDQELVYVPQGSVVADPQAVALTSQSSQDDTYLSTGRPIGVTLKDLGLGGSDAFESSTGAFFTLQIKDTLRVFDNSATGTDKAPATTYYYHESGQWRTLGGQNADDVVIPASTGIVIRKLPNTTSTGVWTAQAPY